ncbi:MAG: DUF951 domain-containing protein [Chloroflexi bacterium]|nr:DUF951 domain-containing protein [Chloroflexota bacterium]
MPVEVNVDDIVRLRKVHPCGSYEWRVVRIGADIGLKCLKCGRRVLLPRSTFERRLKSFISRAAAPPPEAAAPTRWLSAERADSDSTNTTGVEDSYSA